MIDIAAELEYNEDRTRRYRCLDDIYEGLLQSKDYDRDSCQEDDEIELLIRADKPSMFANQW